MEEKLKEILANHDLVIESFLGSGTYGSVYKVRNLKYDEFFAVKVIKMDQEMRIAPNTEIQLLIEISHHSNIISIYNHFIEEGYLFIVFEYCENGSADSLKGKLSGVALYKFTKQMIQALAHCHQHHIAHRDIKPANILVDKYGRPKLADFGLSKEATERDGERCGSIGYMAPELFKNAKFDLFKADVWSLGLTLYTLAIGKLPWYESTKESDIKMQITLGMVPFPKGFDGEYALFLRKMIVTNPNHRKSAEDLLKEPFMENLDLEEMSVHVKLDRRSTSNAKFVLSAPMRPIAKNLSLERQATSPKFILKGFSQMSHMNIMAPRTRNRSSTTGLPSLNPISE